ncbi:MAG: GGDEF domain-containing protein, partial [Mobilitalea sp.]
EQAQEIVDGYITQYRLSEQLNLDVLTGLYNRRTLFELLSTEIANADADNVNSLFLAVLDMDNFKNINDTYGHAQGDKVLLYMSQLLKIRTESIGYPSRYGGEEFAIVFKSTNKINVIQVLEKIRYELSEHEFQFTEDSPIVHSTVSSGLVKYSSGQSVAEFFQAADKAMYQAKQEGRNRIVFN